MQIRLQRERLMFRLRDCVRFRSTKSRLMPTSVKSPITLWSRRLWLKRPFQFNRRCTVTRWRVSSNCNNYYVRLHRLNVSTERRVRRVRRLRSSKPYTKLTGLQSQCLRSRSRQSLSRRARSALRHRRQRQFSSRRFRFNRLRSVTRRSVRRCNRNCNERLSRRNVSTEGYLRRGQGLIRRSPRSEPK